MLMVYIACRNEIEAKYIATHLLETKLIACANLFPSTSLYWWKEKITEESEVVIIAKTLKKHFEVIRKEVLKTHSYDVPCVVAYEAKKVHKEYRDWVERTVHK